MGYSSRQARPSRAGQLHTGGARGCGARDSTDEGHLEGVRGEQRERHGELRELLATERGMDPENTSVVWEREVERCLFSLSPLFTQPLLTARILGAMSSISAPTGAAETPPTLSEVREDWQGPL